MSDKRTYDNQPSLQRVKDRLAKDGWNQDQINRSEYHTVLQERVSGSGNVYDVELLGVFEDGKLHSAFSVSRNNRMFTDNRPYKSVQAPKDTYVDNEEAREKQGDQREQNKAKAHERSLLNDLVNAMTDGLDGYPKTWGTLEYFRYDRNDRKRYPDGNGVKYLVERGVPIIWNPTHQTSWSQAQQDAITKSEKDREYETRKQTADATIKAADELLDAGEIDQERRNSIAIDAGIYLASGAWPKKQETEEMPVRVNPDEPQDDGSNKPVKIKDLPDQEDAVSESEAQADDDEADAKAILSGEVKKGMSDVEEAAWKVMIASSEGNGHDFGIVEDLGREYGLIKSDALTLAQKIESMGLVVIEETILVNDADEVTQFTLTEEGFRKIGREDMIEDDEPEQVQAPSRGIQVME